jgi:sulfopyruvate decarboxylase alpha subunit
MTTAPTPRLPPHILLPPTQPFGTIWPWQPSPVFSLLPVSHAPGPKASPGLQITVTTGHVDNPARGVKFRRHQAPDPGNSTPVFPRDKREAFAPRSCAKYKPDDRDDVANEKSSRKRENKMAVAEQQTSPPTSQEATWHGVVLQSLKRNDIHLVPYVPDRVLTTLIKNLHADPFFTTFPTAREEEAVGIVSGAWMGGMRGAVLMQTSGFATLANVLASLAMPYQIPLIMFVSERGTLGEFNYGQSLVCRTMRPVLDSLAMEHHTCTRLEEFEFIVDRSIKQAITTQAPVALILSPLLTGGKTFDK